MSWLSASGSAVALLSAVFGGVLCQRESDSRVLGERAWAVRSCVRCGVFQMSKPFLLYTWNGMGFCRDRVPGPRAGAAAARVPSAKPKRERRRRIEGMIEGERAVLERLPENGDPDGAGAGTAS